ncbi:aminotransferase class V-fold PLP-dependent enzyme [Thermodesulfobacteriota bacterium]
MDNFDAYRADFPITADFTFMNNASISSPSTRVVEAVASLFNEFSRKGLECYSKWVERVAEVRQLFAGLVQCSAEEIAFVPNTSEGLGMIATGLAWKKGDVILIPEPEFPANVYPWLNLERQGVKVRFIKRNGGRFGIAEVDRAMESGTRLISVSSVDFLGGFRCDLEALGDYCRRKGLLFCVDAVQSLGLIPMDVKKSGIHFMAAGSHKWLLSSVGSGILYISREVNDRVHPNLVGWRSVNNEEDFLKQNFDLKPNAHRFETGSMNLPGIYALGAAVELLMEVGVEKIYPYVLELNKILYDYLKKRNINVVTPMGKNERSGIMTFVPASRPKEFARFLTENQVMYTSRGGTIRLSPHFYNNVDDVNAFVSVMDQF